MLRIACLRYLRALLTGFTDDRFLLTHFPDKSGPKPYDSSTHTSYTTEADTTRHSGGI
ncbi:hypothetical protein CY34DRAFT_19998 [Suillus luteus UH-Slu-Lm8-n1]|uniref:Uncharacterized protein n=1 Tax=Suillus luteus UH-Slu-Lm8-n1 TaxID=930992 RepID=A0A0C9ZZK0_9AGAM|nr:hypothetical protein CY34DRAFT_19998 [Suillus luteus UH-Slu-Lm8-n1]